MWVVSQFSRPESAKRGRIKGGFPRYLCLPAESPDYKPRINWSRFHDTMPLEEAARTGGRATVEDLQRSSSMPLEDYSGGAGKNMGELGAPWGRLVSVLLLYASLQRRAGQEYGRAG